MSWLGKLRDAQATSSSSAPFGWYQLHGQVGFAYGGTLFLNDGLERRAGIADQEIAKIYRPHGEADPWFRACRLITDQRRPELDAIVATAFAAPLFHLISAGGACVSVTGPSGSSKSTSLEVAASVWGQPQKALDIHLAATERGIIGKLGALRHLPLYWDVPLVPASRDMMFDVATMMLAQGNTGARWAPNQTMQEVQAFETIVTMGSHKSFWNSIATDSAALYRTFEIELATPKPSDPGQLKVTEAVAIMDDLKSNYGQVGLAYAKVLARSRGTIRGDTFAAMQWFENHCQTTRPERLWLSLAAAILTGATYGNKLGCEFDLDRLRAFLGHHIETLRAKLAGVPVGGSSLDSTEGNLNAFLEHFLARSVWTDKMVPIGRRGNAKMFNIKVLKAPDKARIAQGAHVHYVLRERVIMFRRDTFLTFLASRGVTSESVIMTGLQKNFGALIYNQKTLLKGTPYVHTRANTLVILTVLPGSPLERLLFIPEEDAVSEAGLTKPTSSGQKSATPGME